jgi:hypothetical protein
MATKLNTIPRHPLTAADEVTPAAKQGSAQLPAERPAS